MKIFSHILERALQWAQHRHASYYLSGLSVAESCVLPFPPPDVMLAPMVMARPKRAWHYAALTTLTSVLGGAVGYLLGIFLFELIAPYLQQWGYWGKYQSVLSFFNKWGVWAVLIAGFSPIPYKLFTIGAGVLNMAFVPFILASLLGRGARFFLVAAIIVAGGEKMQNALRKHVDRLGWLVVIIAVVLYLILRE